jgi:hypothetical protein
MRKVVGVILAVIGGAPLLLLPLEILWAVLECGPANSSCHHFPYRLAALSLICIVLFAVGLKLVMGSPRPDKPTT